jgi:hypothetical protein
MNALIPCEHCGKICSGRSDKKCCSNLCAVKLNYCEKHNFLTPYQKYLCMMQNYSEPHISNKEPPLKVIFDDAKITKEEIEDNSGTALLNAQKKLIEFNNTKTN